MAPSSGPCRCTSTRRWPFMQRGAAATACSEQARNGGGQPQGRTRCSPASWRGPAATVATQPKAPGTNHMLAQLSRHSGGDPASIRIRTSQRIMPRYDDRYDYNNRYDRHGRHGSNTKLYVGQVSPHTRTQDLEDLFSKYGRFVGCHPTSVSVVRVCHWWNWCLLVHILGRFWQYF